MAEAILVVDMLRGFLEPGYPLYAGDEARRIIPNVQGLIENGLENGAKIFFIADSHNPNDLEFEMFPPHCINGTEETEIVPELAEYPAETITKKRYSAFFNTNLDEELKKLAPERLVICGVLTDICVLHTAADARSRDYAVTVPVNCVAALDEQTQHFALEHMEMVLGVKLTRFEEA